MEQDSKDANNMLAELDRGLQTQFLGDQCDAVVRFSSLFQRYPFPVLINSACLKLAESFRVGSNFLRIQISEVFERCQNHLDKIYNVDEFYRCIFSVTNSNDPIARSITLMTLGNIASIVSNYKSAHHCIRSTLESNIESEMNAAIYCAACYVRQSAEFACNIYPKIVSIIDSSDVPLDTKIKALSILDHEFYNANDAMMVRSFLIKSIDNSQTKKFICASLTLSTKIAFTSLSHISPQIDLLLKKFLDDPRRVIKLNALRNLQFLAEKSPHIWESKHVESLLGHLEHKLRDRDLSARDERILYLIILIFCRLMRCQCNFIENKQKQRIFNFCLGFAHDRDNLQLCALAFELFTIFCSECTYQSMMSISQAPLAKEILDVAIAFLNDPRSAQDTDDSAGAYTRSNYKRIYSHIVKICSLHPKQSVDVLKSLFKLLTSHDLRPDELSPYVCEAICAITSNNDNWSMPPEDVWSVIKPKLSKFNDINLIHLIAFYFQTLSLYESRKIDEQFRSLILAGRSLWFAFRVIRQLMRYGHHQVASSICKEIQKHVTTDITDYYFRSLSKITAAEAILIKSEQVEDSLVKAIQSYEDAIFPMRASLKPSKGISFQMEFLRLRIKYLQVHQALRQCCTVHQTSPTTFSSINNSTIFRDNESITKGGIITLQMPKMAKDFRQLSESYSNLLNVLFNCDEHSLSYLLLVQRSCLIMADSIDAVFQVGKVLPTIGIFHRLHHTNSSTGDDTSAIDKVVAPVEQRALTKTCNKLIESIKVNIIAQGQMASVKSPEVSIQLLKSYSTQLLKVPFSYPRYFFQPLQSTQIKLALTPQPTSNDAPIVQILNANLVLKVEGLIQNSSNKLAIRKVSKVILSLLMSPTKNSSNSKPYVISLQAEATPVHDYFITEFLLSLAHLGMHSITVEASIMDNKEQIWRTGPTVYLNVQVVDH